MLTFIGQNSSNSDLDDDEVPDIFIFDGSTIPNSRTPTQLPVKSSSSNRPPPVRQFGKTSANSSPTKFLATRSNSPSKQVITGINVVKQKPQKNILSFKDYLKIFSAVLAGIILLSSIALLILSILTPSLINSIFSPALNILQTQIISGFGIITGAVWGIMQIRNHYNNSFDDYNCIGTNYHAIS